MTTPRGRDGRDPTDDVTRAAKVAAGLGLAFTAASASVFGMRTAGSVLLGATIAIANLLTLRAIIKSMMQGDEAGEASSDANPSPDADHKATGNRGGAAWGIFAVFKIVILFGGIWLLLSKDLVDPIPLVVGYGVLPLGIAASSLLSSLSPGARRK
jgi:hypothetical protein